MISLSYTTLRASQLRRLHFLSWFKPSPFIKILVKCQTELLIFHYTISLSHKELISLSYTTLRASQLRRLHFLSWFKPSPFIKILVKCQTELLIFHYTISLSHTKFLLRKFLMMSLNMICGLRPPNQNPA